MNAISTLCILGGLSLGVAGFVWFQGERPCKAALLCCVGAGFVALGFVLSSISGRYAIEEALKHMQ